MIDLVRSKLSRLVIFRGGEDSKILVNTLFPGPVAERFGEHEVRIPLGEERWVMSESADYEVI